MFALLNLVEKRLVLSRNRGTQKTRKPRHAVLQKVRGVYHERRAKKRLFLSLGIRRTLINTRIPIRIPLFINNEIVDGNVLFHLWWFADSYGIASTAKLRFYLYLFRLLWAYPSKEFKCPIPTHRELQRSLDLFISRNFPTMQYRILSFCNPQSYMYRHTRLYCTLQMNKKQLIGFMICLLLWDEALIFCSFSIWKTILLQLLR